MFRNLKIGKKLSLSFIAIVLIFLIINLISLINLRTLAKQIDIEEHTFEVLFGLEQTLISLIDAETGQRGFILTGEVRYLEPYNRGIALVGAEIDNLETLTVDNPSQQQRIKNLRFLVADKSEELQDTVDLRIHGDTEAAVDIILSDKGKNIMDDIRDLLGEMNDEENRLLNVQRKSADDSQIIAQAVVVWGSLVGTVLSLIVSLLLANLIVKSLTKTRDAANEIAKGNMDVEVNTSGSDEVADLSQSIEIMRQNLKKSLEGMREEKEISAKEKKKIDAILHSIGDGVFVVDAEYKLTMANQVVVNISGFTKEELLGKKYDEVLKFIFEDTGKINDTFIKQAIEKKRIIEMANHTMLIRKDGSKVPVADSAAPLIDTTGKVIGGVVVFRDVTKEREIDRIKTDFLSVAAHQLKTPMGSMRWNLETILEDDSGLTPETREVVEDVYQSNLRMNSLVNDLLNISRMDQGRMLNQPQPTEITKTINQALEELKESIQKKQVAIKFQSPKQLPKIVVDPNHFREVIQNILSNAVKYNRVKGTVTISLKLIEDKVEIVVSDTGIGIPKKDLAKLFSKFYRASNAIKSEADGSGLGLFVVKKYVEDWGGQVKFQSEEGKGTKITLIIPIETKKSSLDQNVESQPHVSN